jgi:hypothetical protein
MNAKPVDKKSTCHSNAQLRWTILQPTPFARESFVPKIEFAQSHRSDAPVEYCAKKGSYHYLTVLDHNCGATVVSILPKESSISALHVCL